MVTVRKADPALMDKAATPTRQLSPAAKERDQQQRQFKRLIAQLKGPEQVFTVRLDPTESDNDPAAVAARCRRSQG